MSRIGRKPISIPEKVEIKIGKNNKVTVKGPKGELTRTFNPDMTIEMKDGQVEITRPTDQRHHRALHGLTRALLANMVTGVSQGYVKELEMTGVGYRAVMKGNALDLSLGFSHPVIIEPPEGISFEVEKGGRAFHVKGIDKEVVGEVAAKIRALRPPEPYKGKGISYRGEYIRRKAGKAGKR
jgi:large subunit ribosomal protein L6